MPYDEDLAARVRERLDRQPGIAEKRMFGGVAFLLNGNLLVGVMNDALIVRLGRDAGAEALLEPHVREFDFTGRPLAGWVVVVAEGIDEDTALADWLARATAFVETLPGK